MHTITVSYHFVHSLLRTVTGKAQCEYRAVVAIFKAIPFHVFFVLRQRGKREPHQLGEPHWQ